MAPVGRVNRSACTGDADSQPRLVVSTCRAELSTRRPSRGRSGGASTERLPQPERHLAEGWVGVAGLALADATDQRRPTVGRSHGHVRRVRDVLSPEIARIPGIDAVAKAARLLRRFHAWCWVRRTVALPTGA